MDPLSKEELKNFLTIGEGRAVEFKRCCVLEDQGEILEQLCGFANREGGTILFGVTDDAKRERVAFDVDVAVEKISNLVRDKTSPPVAFASAALQDNEGTVLAIKVRRRNSIPHAVVDRAGHEIKTRRYFIRANCGSRMIDDSTLEWLFLHKSDPSIQNSFTAYVPYNRETIMIVTWERGGAFPHRLVGPFTDLSDTQRSTLKDDESSSMMTFITEFMPYAIANQLSWIFRNSWVVQRKGVNNQTIYSTPQVTGDIVDVKDISVPCQGSLLTQLNFDPWTHLSFMKPFSVPPGTKLLIEFDSRGGGTVCSRLILRSDKLFTITISCEKQAWTARFPPGHPRNYVFTDEGKIDESGKLSMLVASVGLTLSFDAKFDFPDQIDEEFDKHFDWAQAMEESIRTEWDWDNIIKSYPPEDIYSIHRDVREILTIVKNLQPKT